MGFGIWDLEYGEGSGAQASPAPRTKIQKASLRSPSPFLRFSLWVSQTVSFSADFSAAHGDQRAQEVGGCEHVEFRGTLHAVLLVSGESKSRSTRWCALGLVH